MRRLFNRVTWLGYNHVTRVWRQLKVCCLFTVLMVCVILNELLFSESLSELRILEIKYMFYDIVFLYFTQFILRIFILDIDLRRPLVAGNHSYLKNTNASSPLTNTHSPNIFLTHTRDLCHARRIL